MECTLEEAACLDGNHLECKLEEVACLDGDHELECKLEEAACLDGDQMESKLEEARVERPQAPAVGPWDAAYEEAFQLQFQNALAVAVHASLPLGLAALLVVVVAAVRSL